jgi:integrase
VQKSVMDMQICDTLPESTSATSTRPAAAERIAWTLSTCRTSAPIRIDHDLLRAYAAAAAPNSLRALLGDVEAFNLWCRSKGETALPASPTQIASWLSTRAADGAAPASLNRYRASLARAHRLLDLPDPTRHERVRLAIAVHRRAVGSEQRQAKPLRYKGAVKDPVRDAARGLNVKAVLAACGDDMTALRDRALLSTAYDTGLRASELVRVVVEDIVAAIDPDARLLKIGRSKGDQDGHGATAYLSPRSVRAIEAWLKAADTSTGPVFRRVIVRRYVARPAIKPVDPRDLHGRAIWDRSKFVGKPAKKAQIVCNIGEKALHPGSVGPIFRAMIVRAVTAGAIAGITVDDLPKLLAGIGAHSTRIGFNQDLFASGETLAGIMDALRWKSPKMPLVYNRNLAAEAGAAGRLLGKLD